jgi:hypothetical protein
MIAETVNRTNWVGMTAVESNLCNALFRYLTWITAVTISIGRRTYDTGYLQTMMSLKLPIGLIQ